MNQNLYVTGAEHGSGKSVVVLAMMELLSGRGGRTGFFRPVIADGDHSDPLIELIGQRYRLDQAPETFYGCRRSEARQLLDAGRYDELLKRILARYRALAAQCDTVLCAGTDYAGGHSTLEFDFNADVANNLGCLIMPVVRGSGRDDEQIQERMGSFIQSLRERKCEILATVVNGVGSGQIDSLGRRLRADTPVYLVPEVPLLSQPTLADIVHELGAGVIYGDATALSRPVKDFRVAAMQVPDFLEYITEGSLVITPGDRADIILASFMSYPSTASPQIAGLLLCGALAPADSLVRLLRGLGDPPFAILDVDTDTFTTAMNVSRVEAGLQADDEHKIAAALGAVETAIDREQITGLLSSRRSTRMTPLMFEYELLQAARAQPMHIVLPEGEEERILRAAEILHLRGVAKLTLLGREEEIRRRIQALGLQLPAGIIDPMTSPLRERYAQTYFELRRHKGISPEMSADTLADVSYFGTMMVHLGDADGMVSGSVHTTQHTIRPSFEIIKTRPGTEIVSSVFLMCLEDRVLVYGDCAVNPEPDARQLADIAVSSAATAQAFGIQPRIAMLSYSTGASGKGDAVDKVREATALARAARPDLHIEGPLQYDAAVDAGVARTKMPESEVAGRATVFIFPDLNTGNNTYKAVQRSAGAVAIGPVLQGLNKPVNDLSRGCTVTDIVNTVAITAIQAQGDRQEST